MRDVGRRLVADAVLGTAERYCNRGFALCCSGADPRKPPRRAAAVWLRKEHIKAAGARARSAHAVALAHGAESVKRAESEAARWQPVHRLAAPLPPAPLHTTGRLLPLLAQL